MTARERRSGVTWPARADILMTQFKKESAMPGRDHCLEYMNKVIRQMAPDLNGKVVAAPPGSRGVQALGYDWDGEDLGRAQALMATAFRMYEDELGG